jgi:hypothetical protein
LERGRRALKGNEISREMISSSRDEEKEGRVLLNTDSSDLDISIIVNWYGTGIGLGMVRDPLFICKETVV